MYQNICNKVFIEIEERMRDFILKTALRALRESFFFGLGTIYTQFFPIAASLQPLTDSFFSWSRWNYYIAITISGKFLPKGPDHSYDSLAGVPDSFAGVPDSSARV